MNRHEGIEWAKIQAKLDNNPEKLWSLHTMESTGGEPDVVVPPKVFRAMGNDEKTDEYIFMIVPRKVLKAGEAFVMTMKPLHQGNNISRKTVQ